MASSTRRLAAVWFADIVGYTRLSSRDEEAALGLIELFQQLSTDIISEHGGRLVHFVGDAVLADFPSAESAVRAALDLEERFAATSSERGLPSQLHIGVHVGDVNTTATGDIFGDGVNTAARLTEQVALPGQVVVSQDVWRNLKPRTEFAFSVVGPRRLQGLSADIWVFQAHRSSSGVAGGDVLPLPDPPLGGRIRALLRNTALYFLAAFLVLVLGQPVRIALGLPDWTAPASAVLLAIGLVVIIATSWVQSRPSWQRTVRSQERPWHRDLREVGAELAERRFPDLTWPRAIIGGVLAFSLLVLAGGIYVLFRDGTGGLLRPGEAYAAAGPGVAILPFDTEGDHDELWREGMLDLLSMNLDGAAGLRVIDPRVVVSRWDRERGYSLASKLELAQQSGARFVVLGSLRSSEADIEIEASVHDLQQGRQLGRAEVAGPLSALPRLVDDLSEQILALGFGPARAGSKSPRLQDLSTASLTALRAYLAGEQFFRLSRWHEAELEFRRAVAADPEFALALYRLSMTEAWSEVPHLPRSNAWGQRAARLLTGLSERDSLLIRAYSELNRSSSVALEILDEFTRRYPDDVEGWFLLGDADYHLNRSAPPGARRFREAFRRAIELDPKFGPAYLHLIDDAVARGDSLEARATLAEFRRADPGSPLLTGFDWAYALSRLTAPAPAVAPVASAAVNPQTAPGAETALGRARQAWLERIASMRAEVDRARAGAVAGSPEVEQGRGWEALAVQAERSENWPEVIENLARAEEAYRRAAAPAPREAGSGAVAPPAPAPAPVPQSPAAAPRAEEELRPDAIAQEILGQVKRAIEAEDIKALQRVWPSLSPEEAGNWRQLFAQANELRADFSIQAADLESSEQVRVRVLWTYTYQNASTRRRDTHTTTQTLILRQRDSSWVIVAR